MLTFKVGELEGETRADVFARHKMPQISRSFIHKLFTSGLITINGRPNKPSHNLKPGDKIKIDYDFNSQGVVEEIKLPIIYEDDDCLVINKPAGLLTHSKGVFNPEPTVATFISDKVDDLTGERAGIVHRLDRATSGVIVAAKTEAAQKWLQKQFSTRKVQKIYLAIVAGRLEPAAAVIDMPIERNPKKPQTFRAGPNGKPAQTTYKAIESNGRYSLVELLPKTGRTHQLRVHLKHLGHPIIGDTFYDGPVAERLFLHAKSLKLVLPDKTLKTFISPIPKEFMEFFKRP